MAHKHLVYDSDPHFSVDVDTRVISYQSPSKLVLVKDDHNSEIFTFDMPKEVDGHDVTLCDIKRIHYINLGSGKEESKDIYEIKDLQVSEEDENKVVFSWLVSSNATKYAGTLSFAIRRMETFSFQLRSRSFMKSNSRLAWTRSRSCSRLMSTQRR